MSLPWLALAALLLLAVPLFLRMPPTVDVAFYGVCAETLLQGGILDRDIVMLQPPGMSWLVAAVHALLGDSVIALRGVDLVIVAAIVALLLRWQRSMISSAGLGWLGVALAAFYLTTSEWVHAQPDTWMLLPALAALTIHRRLLEARASRWLALVEGLLWGFGCLIKPFVILP
jgi:4-amino-4-deoxy-L-arabinose transferase-like glycosyltransferase